MSERMEREAAYRLVHRIGQGSASEVFLGRRVHVGEPDGPDVAVKRILPLMASNPALMKRFARQASLCLPLEHKNLVRLLDFGEHDERQYLVMQYVDGASLAALRVAATAGGFRMSLPMVTFAAREIAEALSALHHATDDEGRPLGLVHRNLSPPNVLISREGQVKLADFTHVKSLGDAESSRGPRIKSVYLAPEQVASNKADARTDVFQLGVIFLETLVGKRPPELGDPAKVVKELLRMAVSVDVPLPLLYVVKRAVALDPAERYPTAREMADALTQAMSQERLEAREPDLAKLLSLALPHTEPPAGGELDEVVTLHRPAHLKLEARRLTPGPDEPAAAPPDVATTTPHPVFGAPPPKPRLGDILVSKGRLTAAQLADALTEQRREGRRLGQILRERKLVEDQELIRALSAQSGTPFIQDLKLDALAPSPDAVALLSRADADRLACVPMMIRGDELYVAMADAHDEAALAELGRLTGRRVKGVFATPQALERAQERFYRQAPALTHLGPTATPRDTPASAAPPPPASDEAYRKLLHRSLRMLGGTAAAGPALSHLCFRVSLRLGADEGDADRAAAAGCLLAMAAHLQEERRYARPSREVLRDAMGDAASGLWDLLDAAVGEHYPFPEDPAPAAVAAVAAYAHAAGGVNTPATPGALGVLEAQGWVSEPALTALKAELAVRQG